MKPQYQLRKEPNGDCLRACVASLLEVKIKKVPDFVLAPAPDKISCAICKIVGGIPDCPSCAGTGMVHSSPYPAWWVALQSWLAEMGLFFLEIQLPPNMPWMPLPLASLCILFGETTTGVKHAIVGRCEGADFFPLFNPWPEAEFAGGVAAVGFILARDPSMPIKLGMSLEKVGKFAGQITGAIGEAITTEVNQTFHRQQESLDGLIA